MAEEASIAGTNPHQTTVEGPEAAIEINIKTLDSKIYTFRVNRDMPVAALKAKLVDVSGVPVERQRLIFRGKVLKDDHLLSEYQLEDGHTLHLVARQPVEGQSSSGTHPEGTVQDNNNQGNDSAASAPRNRIGQVSHGVLLGTVNVADQGESIVDIGRLVGAVLSSLGVGNATPTGPPSGMPSATTASNQPASSADAESNLNSGGSPAIGNLPPPGFTPSPGFTVLNNAFQSLHQIPQFPSAGILSRHMTIPDSLTTLSEFISRMELVLQNGGLQSSPSNANDPLQTESSFSVARGLPTPETLQRVMEQAQHLLRGNATAALSRFAAHLEREGTSTDAEARSQIQAEAMHVGAAMQHLGAMLLELGRAIMTLRMGQCPADSAVNAGPAVYISSMGPNPIMVQPFPLQASTLFGTSPTPLGNGVSVPAPTGEISRNINIHIHAGSPLIPGVSNAAARANSGEAVHGEQSNARQASREGNSRGASAATRGVAPRTVVAAIPARPAQTSGHVLSVIYPVHVRSQLSVPIPTASAQVANPTVSSGTQPTHSGVLPPSAESGTLSNIISQISAQVANALAAAGQGVGSLSQGLQSIDAQGSQAQSGMASQADQALAEAGAQSSGSSSSMQNADSSHLGPQQAPSGSLSSNSAQTDEKDPAGNVDAEKTVSTASVIPTDPAVNIARREGEELPQESSGDPSLVRTEGLGIDTGSSVTTSQGEISNDGPDDNNLDSVATSHFAQLGQKSDSNKPTPLGLGLGGLQTKRRSKTIKPTGKDKVTIENNQNQQSIARGQQFLQSLLPQSSNVNGTHTDGSSNPQTSIIGKIMDNLPLGRQGHDGEGQVDAADMMSQILRTPAFNNLLTGVAEQTGIGSSNDLKTMLEQCTQSPAVRNTLNNIAQQVEGQSQSGSSIFTETGRGQGGLDFSRMIQQMMPAVSQALGRGSTRPTPTHGSQHVSQTRTDDCGSGKNDTLHERDSLDDVGHAVEMIERHDSPESIFRSVLENAGHLLGEEDRSNDLIRTLVNNEELTNEFMSMLCRDLHRRLQTDSTPE